MGFTVHPRRLQHFGAPAGAFILITNTAHAGHVRLVPDAPMHPMKWSHMTRVTMSTPWCTLPQDSPGYLAPA